MNIAYMGPAIPEYMAFMERLLPKGFHLIRVEANSPQFWKQIEQADFLAVLTPITQEIIDRAKRAKLIQIIGAGYDNVDLIAAAKAGIPVASTDGSNATSVAEHVFALILALYRRLPYAHNSVKMGLWPQLELYRGKVFELFDKTIGLVGFGYVGQAIARIAKGFNMRVLYYRRRRLAVQDEQALGVNYACLEDLLQESDIVSIQVPLTPETKGLIGQRELGLMKRDAILINVSRGAVINEDALIEALLAGKIAGAGLDVFAMEPLSPDHPFLKMDNVILTPHMGGAAQEAVQRTLSAAITNILRVATGEKPYNLVALDQIS